MNDPERMTNPIEVTEAVARAMYEEARLIAREMGADTTLDEDITDDERAFMGRLANAAILAMQQASPDAFANAPIIEQVGKLLANDPICNGRVAQGTVEAIAALVAGAPRE